MSNIHGFVQQDNVARASDGTSVGLRATRDGALIQIPWLQALCLEGRMFGIQAGDGTIDPVGAATFGAGAVNLNEFDYFHTVPATVAVLPVYFNVAFLAIGTVGESGLHLGWGSGGVLGGSAVTATIYNMRPGSSNSSACTVVTADDGGGTNITLAGIFYENVTAALTGAANTPAQFVPPFSVETCGFIPVIEGSRQIAGWANGVASTGYLTSNWVELPISAVN